MFIKVLMGKTGKLCYTGYSNCYRNGQICPEVQGYMAVAVPVLSGRRHLQGIANGLEWCNAYLLTQGKCTQRQCPLGKCAFTMPVVAIPQCVLMQVHILEHLALIKTQVMEQAQVWSTSISLL